MKITNHVITIFIVLAITVTSITSCSNSKWEADYPDGYTYEYLTGNYTRADPNLEHMHIAENGLGPFERSPSGYASYWAIKDVPVEEYLVMCNASLLSSIVQLVKSKQDEPPSYEVLEWDIERVELIVVNYNAHKLDTRYGKDRVYHQLGKLNDESVSEMQEYIQECLDTENYYEYIDKDFQQVKIDGKNIFIRVFFKKYENIVWDANISEVDGNYYIQFWIYDETIPEADDNWGKYHSVRMPLNEALSTQIREALEAN